ncbi:MAG: flavin reductase, partial [Oscillospiraceae bacterium]|nr:flavin reductase [Oscillospiraceae bacterium]
MDTKAFRKMSYGLFLLTVREGEKENGCIINTAIQCASEPRLISICAIKQNLTNEIIGRTGIFNLTVLPESIGYETYKVFGMTSGRNEDKFAHYPDAPISENGLRYLAEGNALFQCKVVDSKDLGSHVQYIADVTGAKVLSEEPSATYAYYQSAVKNPAPKTEKSGWRCKICGHIYEGELLPEDYICPLCKHGAEDFERIGAENKIEIKINNKNEKGDTTMKKFVCKVCGYVHTGDSAPAECPVCHVGAHMFEEVQGEMKLAAEHEYGVYA